MKEYQVLRKHNTNPPKIDSAFNLRRKHPPSHHQIPTFRDTLPSHTDRHLGLHLSVISMMAQLEVQVQSNSEMAAIRKSGLAGDQAV
jgi:hypothetical protein